MSNYFNKTSDKESASNYFDARISDLKFSAFTPELNPGVLGIQPSKVYPLVSRFNPIKTKNFGNVKNLTGNIIPRLLTSNNSRMNAAFDTLSLKLNLRYMFLSAKTDTANNSKNDLIMCNRAFNDTCVEALANAQAQQMIQLPFFTMEYYDTAASDRAPRIGANKEAMHPCVA